MGENYYVNQINRALEEHDPDYDLSIKIIGTKFSTQQMKLPIELARIIRGWYSLNPINEKESE